MWETEFVIGTLIFSILTIPSLGYADLDLNFNNLKEDTISTSRCIKSYQILWRFVPQKGENAGDYESKPEIHNIRDCLDACCIKKKCNVVFMHNEKCFHVRFLFS